MAEYVMQSDAKQTDLKSLAEQMANINKIVLSTVEWFTVYPNGKDSWNNSRVTIPVINPNKNTVTIADAWVRDSATNTTNIKSSLSITATYESYVSLNISFNSSYVGQLFYIKLTVAS